MTITDWITLALAYIVCAQYFGFWQVKILLTKNKALGIEKLDPREYRMKYWVAVFLFPFLGLFIFFNYIFNGGNNRTKSTGEDTVPDKG